VVGDIMKENIKRAINFIKAMNETKDLPDKKKEIMKRDYVD